MPFWVTLVFTLTSYLMSKFFVSGAHLIYYKHLQICLMLDQFFWGICRVTVTFLVSSEKVIFKMEVYVGLVSMIMFGLSINSREQTQVNCPLF